MPAPRSNASTGGASVTRCARSTRNCPPINAPSPPVAASDPHPLTPSPRGRGGTRDPSLQKRRGRVYISLVVCYALLAAAGNFQRLLRGYWLRRFHIIRSGFGAASRVHAQEERTERRGCGGEERACKEGSVVAAIERGERRSATGQQTTGARGGKAGENGEAKRAAHHERGVEDARGQARFARLDIIHGSQQHRIEGDASAQTEQDHIRQYVKEEVATERRTHKEQQPNSRQPQSGHQCPLDAEAHHQPGGEAK